MLSGRSKLEENQKKPLGVSDFSVLQKMEMDMLLESWCLAFNLANCEMKF